MTAENKDCNPNHNLPFKIKQDVIVYTKDSGCTGIMDSQHAEIIMEFKWLLKDDLFYEPYKQTIGEGDRQEKANMFICGHKVARDTLGQIIGYSAAQLGAQYCIHILSVFIVRDKYKFFVGTDWGLLYQEHLNMAHPPTSSISSISLSVLHQTCIE